MKLTATVAVGSITITGNEIEVVTGFNVYRGSVSGGPYIKVNPALIPYVATTPNLTYTDNTVEEGQTYFYVATAVDAGGESGYSGEVSETIPSTGTFAISTQSAGESLQFWAKMYAGNPAPQVIAVIATPATPLPVIATCDKGWLSVTQDSPTTKSNLTVSVNSGGQSAGTHTGHVVVVGTDGTASNSPFKITVTLGLSYKKKT